MESFSKSAQHHPESRKRKSTHEYSSGNDDREPKQSRLESDESSSSIRPSKSLGRYYRLPLDKVQSTTDFQILVYSPVSELSFHQCFRKYLRVEPRVAWEICIKRHPDFIKYYNENKGDYLTFDLEDQIIKSVEEDPFIHPIEYLCLTIMTSQINTGPQRIKLNSLVKNSVDQFLSYGLEFNRSGLEISEFCVLVTILVGHQKDRRMSKLFSLSETEKSHVKNKYVYPFNLDRWLKLYLDFKSSIFRLLQERLYYPSNQIFCYQEEISGVVTPDNPSIREDENSLTLKKAQALLILIDEYERLAQRSTD